MKILIIDDQHLNRLMLGSMLEKNGYVIFLASNGEEGLSMFDEVDPDLVLLDVMMPVLDGMQTAPLLKQRANARSSRIYLPIIFITALDDKERLSACLEAGGDDFLTKPFDNVVLLAKVKAHLRTRQLSIKSDQQRKSLEYYKAQVAREHEIVEHIFANAVQQIPSSVATIDYYMSPASMFNGDVFLMAYGPLGNVYVLMGDFTGHGLSSAIGSLPLSRIFYSMATKGLRVSDIAREANRQLCQLLPIDMFCAAAIFDINKHGNRCSVWSGGFPDIYVLSESAVLKETVHSMHLALGILPDDEFNEATYELPVVENDRIVVATDGIVETMNSHGELFSEKRLIDTLMTLPMTKERVMTSKFGVDEVIQAIQHYSEGTEQGDDLSLAMILCAPVEDGVAPVEPHRVNRVIPFKLSQVLGPDDIKLTEPIGTMLSMLSNVDGLIEHRSPLFMILSELYSNALEHGLLQLSSDYKVDDAGFSEYYALRTERIAAMTEGTIRIAIEYIGGNELYIEVEDSGPGYDINKHSFIDPETGMRTAELPDKTLSYSRGLALVAELSSGMKISEKGNLVQVTYSLNQNESE